MRDKLINFFFIIRENVESNENGTMSISLNVKSRFGNFGLFLWTILETIREGLVNGKLQKTRKEIL